MKRAVLSIRLLSLAFALVLLGTSCTKEDLVEPAAPASSGQNVLKSTNGTTIPNTSNGQAATTDPKTDPSGISDDGDDLGDRERGRGKRR